MPRRISVVYECGCKAGGPVVNTTCPDHGRRWVEQWEGLHEVEQPEDGACCGQACAAMVLGISLEESIELFGHDGATYPREIAAIIRVSGIPCLPKMKRTRGKTLPKRGVLRVVWCTDGKARLRKGHWLVLWDGKIYDPSPQKKYAELAPKGGAKVTAYLEIEA